VRSGKTRKRQRKKEEKKRKQRPPVSIPVGRLYACLSTCCPIINVQIDAHTYTHNDRTSLPTTYSNQSACMDACLKERILPSCVEVRQAHLTQKNFLHFNLSMSDTSKQASKQASKERKKGRKEGRKDRTMTKQTLMKMDAKEERSDTEADRKTARQREKCLPGGQ